VLNDGSIRNSSPQRRMSLNLLKKKLVKSHYRTLDGVRLPCDLRRGFNIRRRCACRVADLV
jgi:hypothetical protein